MNKRLRRGLIFLLAAVFMASAAKIVQQTKDYQEGSQLYSEALQVANLPQIDVPQGEPEVELKAEPEPELNTVPEGKPEPEPEVEPKEEEPIQTDPYAQALAEADLAALQAVNGDVIGWISIPGTLVSYPLLQGEDNDYYLRHTWNRVKNSVGSIVMEHLVSSDLSDFNTLIYGHDMRNGSMFGSLHQYENMEHWEAHPKVYITTAAGVYQYDIFAAYEAKLDEITYGLQISEPSTKQKFIQHGLDSSVIDTGIIPTEKDRILTLVTCTGRDYSGRWVVQAVLREPM